MFGFCSDLRVDSKYFLLNIFMFILNADLAAAAAAVVHFF